MPVSVLMGLEIVCDATGANRRCEPRTSFDLLWGWGLPSAGRAVAATGARGSHEGEAPWP